MNKPFMKLLCALFLAIGSLALYLPAARAQHVTAPAAGEAGKTAEQVFKNIQALKGTPADQLQTSMQFISNSLGVECEFCHVQGAFDKDDKKTKQTARQMIQMQMAINRDNFKGEREVTCFSCHRGSHDPVAVPIISDEESKRPETPKTEAAAPALPTADQIIDKYIQAAGGADALHKITSRVETGTINFGGRQLPLEVVAKAPDKRISTVHMQNGDSITAFDGHAGWLGNPGGRPPRDMTEQESDAASFDAQFYLPLEIKKMFTQFRVRPADKVAGHDVYMLIGIKEGKPPLRFFFDQQSGLLLRTIRYADTPLGRNPTEVDYADYRDDGGVKVPHQWTVARPLGRFTIQVTELKQNVPVADSKFEKPAAKDQPAQK
ncbi:MAG TPA: c-type cytochrome [Candidatus Angelobacter sp.]|nr:c-type cytochrome [Candidatus Angelobacter sp.]